MTQALLWQNQKLSADYAELCNALYEHELNLLVKAELSTVQALQSRLKSLPHYIKRTAYAMTQTQTPLILDVQNASWTAKQLNKIPLKDQQAALVWQWYEQAKPPLGLVIPIYVEERIVLDCIDRVDVDKFRFRTNAFGWFEQDKLEKPLFNQNQHVTGQKIQLLKPTKRVMIAACAGHRWKNNMKVQPVSLSLRELLLSCSINWRNFKRLLPSA